MCLTSGYYNFLGDNKTIQNIDLDVAATKRFIFPFTCFYKPGISDFINIKHSNRLDAKPYFILAISNIYARTYKLLKVLWTARRSNQLILKEINPEYSLEGLKLKLQYFGRLM